jgi:hypothetical protein
MKREFSYINNTLWELISTTFLKYRKQIFFFNVFLQLIKKKTYDVLKIIYEHPEKYY